MHSVHGRWIALGVVAIAMSGAHTPAGAQAWIGSVVGNMVAQEKEHACMIGTVLPDAEIAEARDPATATMQLYWSRASAGDAADVSAAFHPRGSAEWVTKASATKRAGLARINDPIARGAGMTLAAAPVRFVRAGDGGSARGMWQASGAAGSSLYLADFDRRAGIWKLSRLEGGAADGGITQYCHKPGDVEVYQAAIAEREARRAAKKAAKRARQEASAR